MIPGQQGQGGFADLAGEDGGDYDDDGDAGALRPGGSKKSRRTLVTMILVLAILGVVGGVGYAYVNGHGSAPDYADAGAGTVEVVIAKGDTASAIAQTLFKDGVVKSAQAFVDAAVADPNSSRIQPGAYTLHKQMSAQAALAALLARGKDGRPLNALVWKVTVPEGYVSTQIYNLLHRKTGVPVADFVKAAKDPIALGVPTAWFANGAGGKSAAKIEGFLFPDTYAFEPGSSAADMLEQMVSEFTNTVSTLDFQNRVTTTLHIAPYDALIAASIAQEEAKLGSDMGPVARVVYNRAYGAFAGHRLGLDSSINYWQKLHGKPGIQSKSIGKAMADRTDPYNTYIISGMPPGPIGNPGKAALTGAMSPPKNKYFFFVTITPSGKMGYATTEAGHETNIKTACRNGVTDLSC